jgi:hypothetical protein
MTPSYTWKIQLSESYSDQFHQKGPIDKEKAIDEFQLFPWDKEIDDYRRRHDNPTSPKIIFTDANGRELMIAAINTKGYELEYTHTASGKRAELYISNSFESSALTVEEMIGLFFDNNIEQHLKLRDIPPPQTHETKPKPVGKGEGTVFTPGSLSFINLTGFSWIVLAILYYLLWRHPENRMPFIGNVFLAFLWLPPLVVHISYIF